MTVFEINPHLETPVSTERLEQYQLRFAYARSADTRVHNEPGQDFLAYLKTEEEVIFAVCDGVSQSFFGDLAAGFLARSLVEWLAQLKPSQKHQFRQHLEVQLKDWTRQAAPLITNQKLPDNMPAMQKEVLEQKRRSGSEATFICGKLIFPSEKHPKGSLLLAWMGDSRLRLRGPEGELTYLLGNVFETAQRWSSRRGPVGGEVNVYVSNLEGIQTIWAYTDGLQRLDHDDEMPATQVLNQIISEEGLSPLSDDIAFVEIHLLHPITVPPARFHIPAPTQVTGNTDGTNTLTWDAVPGASFYQVEVMQEKPQIFQAYARGWILPRVKHPVRAGVRVRAVQGITPGDWSDSVTVTLQPIQTQSPTMPKPEKSTRPMFIVLWASIVIVLGCVFIAGGGLALRALLPDPTPTKVIVPASTERPTETFPTSQPTFTPTGVPPTKTLYPTRDPNTLPPSATPDPLLINMSRCYQVVAPEGLRLRDKPAGDPVDFVPFGTLIKATGNAGRAVFIETEYIWLEVVFNESYVWLVWKSTDEQIQFLTPCP